MADCAAHLVDRVLPSAGYRQLVLSFPYPLRFHLARDPAFLSQMLGGFLQCVFAWQRHRGRKAGINNGHTGAITFVQKIGAALNLNVHPVCPTPPLRARRLPWASLLKRTLGVDGLNCPVCQAQMVLLALITATDTVTKILDHLRIPSTAPPLAPARLPALQADLLQDDLDQDVFIDEPPCAAHPSSPSTASRAPP